MTRCCWRTPPPVSGSATPQTETGVDISKVVPDTDPAACESTGSALDFGISGQGYYFAVRTTEGVRCTQVDQFTTNKSQLVDSGGDLVLSQSGQPITVSAHARKARASGH